MLGASFEAELSSGLMAGVRVEELIGDVSENGGASRRDAALGDQSKKAGEKLAEINSRREFGELREEVGGKVFRIVVQLEGSGGFGPGNTRTLHKGVKGCSTGPERRRSRNAMNRWGRRCRIFGGFGWRMGVGC